jgi:hypothetical protein
MAQLPFAVVPLPLGTISTGNERTEKPAIHLGEVTAIGMVWGSNGNGNLWVRGDFGSAQTIDFASIVHANAQPSTTYRLRLADTQAAVDGAAAYDSGTLPLISPTIVRDDGLYSSHLELPALQTRRWWRIDIGGHAGDFEAAKLVLGKRIAPSTYYSSGFQYGVEDLGSFSMTPWGIADSQDGLIFRSIQFTLGWLDDTDFETKFRPLAEKLGKRKAVFWCHDPSASPYRQAKTYLGWLRDPQPAVVGGNNSPVRRAMEFNILSMI